jgi:hypothetical protein
MLALNRSLLNGEYNLINVRKALASIVSTRNFNVIFLSKITPRYFTLTTNAMFFLFFKSISMREIDHLILVFIAFNIPAFTPGRH